MARALINVPAKAKRGEIIEIKTLISHPMETGYRPKGDGTSFPRDIIQKFVQYGMGIVVLGDISRHTEVSSALRDFVRECNRGRQTWFLADVEELKERLKG